MTEDSVAQPPDVPAWSRRQLAGIAVVGVLAVVLVAVRLAVPDAAGVAAGAGILVAFAAVAAAVLARRRVRALNRPSDIDRDRAQRITEAHRAGVPVAADDAPAARAIYGAGIGEWCRLAWAFSGLTHLGLAFGLTPSGVGRVGVVIGVGLAVLALAMAVIATWSAARLRTRLVRALGG